MSCTAPDVACPCAAPLLATLPDDACPLRAVVGLPLHERSCGAARRTVRQLLEAWEVGRGEQVHDALVVVSELVGNAVRHGDLRLVLELSVRPRSLLVAVSDGGQGLPQQRSGLDDGECGRGLAIVGALATSWGSEQLPGGGKRVWALLPLHESGPEATEP